MYEFCLAYYVPLHRRDRRIHSRNAYPDIRGDARYSAGTDS
jgi:hypothetical protein